MADSDKQVVTIGWLKDSGYTIKEAYTDNTWCPTFDNITAGTIGSYIGVSATCYGTGAEYTSNQVVCRKDIYTSYVCTCGDLTLSTESLSWTYAQVTGKTSLTVTVTRADCVEDSVTVSSTDEDICTASLSENTITITPKGVVGNTYVSVSYLLDDGSDCTKLISCIFNDLECDCTSISASSYSLEWTRPNVTAKTSSSVTISTPTCITSTPTVTVLDDSLCTASYSSSTLTITPAGNAFGKTSVSLNYAYGTYGSCTTLISCNFLDCTIPIDDIRVSAATVTGNKQITLNVDFESNFKKLKLNLNDGTTKEVNCDNTVYLTTKDISTSYSTDYLEKVTDAEVGYCVTQLLYMNGYWRGTFQWCENMTSVKLPDELRYIGRDAFYGCGKLTSIDIPNNVYAIESYAFRYCSGLTSVTLPPYLTTLGAGAFQGCSGLTGNITIPNSIRKIGDDTFDDCRNLTSITLPSYLTSIGSGAFYDCENWAGSITIPNTVTSIGRSAFWRCHGLTAITLPTNSNFEKIEAYTFYECSHVTSLTVPSSVKKIGPSAFEKMWNLTSITLPTTLGIEGDEYSTKIMSHTFNQAVNLTSLTLPTNITAIGEWAIHKCNKLTSLTIPATVKEIDWLGVSWCDELETITFAANSQLTKIDKSGFEYNRKLVSITFTATTPPSLGQNAFYQCNSLANIYVPSASVDAYKAASGWSSYADKIKAIP